MNLKVLNILKKFFKKLNLKTLILIFILMYSITPIVSRAVSTYLNTYMYMGIVVIAVLFTFISCHLREIRQYVFFLIPFVIYQMITVVERNRDDILLVGYQALLFMLPLCVGFYLMNNKINYNIFAAVIITCFTVTTITTIVGCIANPEAARILATTSNSQDAVAIEYDFQNIGGFSFVYSSVIIYPLVIIAAKMKRIPLAVAIIFAVLMVLLAINTAYSVAMMAVVFSSLLFFIKVDIKPKRFAAMFITGVILILIFSPLVSDIFLRIGKMVGNEEMAEKMAAVFGGAEAMDSLEDKRMDLYMKSFNAFLSNPLLGTAFTGKTVIGGHSFVLDNLARYGAVGGLMMYFMYRNVFNVFYRPFAGKNGYSFIIWMFALTIVLSTLNTGMWPECLCLYAPIILNVIYKRDGSERPENALRPQYVLSPLDIKRKTEEPVA